MWIFLTRPQFLYNLINFISIVSWSFGIILNIEYKYILKLTFSLVIKCITMSSKMNHLCGQQKYLRQFLLTWEEVLMRSCYIWLDYNCEYRTLINLFTVINKIFIDLFSTTERIFIHLFTTTDRIFIDLFSTTDRIFIHLFSTTDRIFIDLFSTTDKIFIHLLTTTDKIFIHIFTTTDRIFINFLLPLTSFFIYLFTTTDKFSFICLLPLTKFSLI